MAEELFNVCVSSPPTFNEELFLKWVNGEVEDDSAHGTSRKASAGGRNHFDIFQFRHTSLTTTFSEDLMKLEIQEQNRMFDVLEHYMSQPLLLSSQQMVLIPRHIQDVMIAYYWSLDNSIVREIIYKRLTKSRKDLDDVADTTGYPLKRVTRQFDNLRRIYIVAEDIQLQSNLQVYIEKNFCLEALLARKYSCILFLLFSKFNLTTKKRMLRVPCEKLENCAALTLTFLASDSDLFFQSLLRETSSGIGALGGGSSQIATTLSPIDYCTSILSCDERCWPAVWRMFGTIETLDLDKQFLINLRDVRTILTGDVLDQACQLVRDTVATRGTTITTRRLLDLSRIRTVLKALAQIGGHLSQTREYRDIFEDFLTKVVEPLEEAGLPPSEISCFLECCLCATSAVPDSARTASTTLGYPPTVTMAQPRSGPAALAAGTNSNGDFCDLFEMEKLSKTDQLRIDWLRFVTFSRLCIQQIS